MGVSESFGSDAPNLMKDVPNFVKDVPKFVKYVPNFVRMYQGFQSVNRSGDRAQITLLWVFK